MCGGVLIPVAPLPLWQLEQLVSVAAWANVAAVQFAVLVWQDSQGKLVGTWFAGLPRAAVPLWQSAHPVVMPA
jgi:hypothetical protein